MRNIQSISDIKKVLQLINDRTETRPRLLDSYAAQLFALRSCFSKCDPWSVKHHYHRGSCEKHRSKAHPRSPESESAFPQDYSVICIHIRVRVLLFYITSHFVCRSPKLNPQEIILIAGRQMHLFSFFFYITQNNKFPFCVK